jgi:hypothetical protein
MIPPQFASQMTAGDENGCRHFVALQQGFGDMKVIAVSVVESYSDSAPRHFASFYGLDQTLQFHRPSVFADYIQVLGEVLRSHAYGIRIGGSIRYPMVAQDEGTIYKPAS